MFSIGFASNEISLQRQIDTNDDEDISYFVHSHFVFVRNFGLSYIPYRKEEEIANVSAGAEFAWTERE